MTESELRYRTLIEQLPLVTYIDALDDRSSNIYTSPQLEPILGYSVEEWRQDEELFVRILHPDDRERVLAQIQATNESGERFECEYRLIARDGRVIWFRDESVVVRDESGAPLYSQGYLLDITDRKTAETDARESLDDLRNAQEALVRREAVLEAVAAIAGELVGTQAWEKVDVVGRLRTSVRTSRAYLVEDVRGSGGPSGQLLAESTDGTVGSLADATSGGRFEYDTDGFGAFRAALERGDIVRRIAGDFPASEQQEWEREGVRSTLVVPIHVGDDYWGHIGFQDCVDERVWTDAEVDALRAGAGILGAAIHRQATRDALAESEARFAAFMDTTPAITFAKDAEGRYVYANARWLELFGHTLDELLGHTDAELFPALAAEFRAHDGAALEAGGSVSKVDRIRVGGTERTLMTLKFPFRDASGEEFVGGVALDITEREQAEQELRATTRLLESIVQSAPVAIVTSDRDGLVTGWNPAAEAMFGWSRAEVLGREPPHFVPGDSDGVDSRTRAQSGRTVADAEGRRLRRDGRIASVRYAKAPLYDADGEVAGTTAILTDVTERKRAERRLAAQHAVARALAESTTLDEAAPRILEEVCGALGWEIGGLWTVDQALDRLRLASIWCSGGRRFERFVDESWSLELDRGEGFPGVVWETGETRWFADVAGSSRSRTAAVASAGLHGALAAPIASGGEILGALELFSTRVWEPDDDLVAMLTSIGSQVGQFLRRTQADQEVREREERFRTLVANLPGAVYRCAVDEDWTMSFLSDVIREITGYPASDFVANAGRSFASVIHGDDRARVARVVGEAVRRKEPFEIEYRITHTDGSLRWVAEKGQPIIGPGGAILWLDGAIFDVTEQKRAEAALARERDLMRFFLEATPDHVYFKDRESRFLRISDTLARWLGLDEASEAIGKTDRDFFTEEHAAKALADEQDVLRTGQAILNLEDRETWPDGSETWVVSSRLPLRDAQREIVGTFGISRDITERKLGEEALARTNHLLDSIVESLPTPLFLKDADDLRFARVNRAAEELFGVPREALIGKSDLDFFPREQAEFFMEKDRGVVDDQRLLDIPEEPLETKELGTRYLHTRKVPIVDESGQSRYLLGISLDITEQKLAAAELERLLAQLEEQNERLRELDRMKDEFVALISHELRTPLTSILGYLELVLEGEAGEVSEDQAHFLAVIERNAQRLLRLVGDLLFVAQIEAGKLTIEREPCDLGQLAADCIEAARPRAGEKQIELAFDGAQRAELLGDRTRLAQLLDNLVSNAIKFTPEGGRVGVRLTQYEGHVVVGVSDTGMGISPDDLANLFQRFFRTSEATRRAIQGTGLGLTITRAIAEAHGGTIEVESTVGVGTTFVVELPVEPALSSGREPVPIEQSRE